MRSERPRTCRPIARQRRFRRRSDCARSMFPRVRPSPARRRHRRLRPAPPRLPGRFGERRAHPVAQEVPEIHVNLGPVAPKGAEIDVLTLGFRRFGGGARHPRREILDRQDIVMRLQDRREQRRQVEPFSRRSLERPIVEIETVHVDEGAHRCPPQKARASEEAPRPSVETTRGVAGNLVA